MVRTSLEVMYCYLQRDRPIRETGLADCPESLQLGHLTSQPYRSGKRSWLYVSSCRLVVACTEGQRQAARDPGTRYGTIGGLGIENKVGSRWASR